jgi:hypothetical protein
MTLSAEASASSSRTYTFRADIVGGRDDDGSLYCQALTWAFGDGPPMTLTPSCVEWTAASKIQRQFTATHEYGKPGTYRVEFTYARLTASRTVVVR